MKALNQKAMTTLTLTVALFGASTLTLAGEPSARIDLAKADFSNSQQVQDIYGNIQQAARMVCRDAASSWDAEKTRTFKRCYEAAVDKAVQDINRYELTVLHEDSDQRLAAE